MDDNWLEILPWALLIFLCVFFGLLTYFLPQLGDIDIWGVYGN